MPAYQKISLPTGTLLHLPHAHGEALPEGKASVASIQAASENISVRAILRSLNPELVSVMKQMGGLKTCEYKARQHLLSARAQHVSR